MLVWRVEKDGVGPYRSSHGGPAALRAYELMNECTWDNLETHPTPLDDVGMKEAWGVLVLAEMDQSYMFGFRNLDQLRRWFPKRVRDALAAAGFRAVRCTVPKERVLIGDYQVAFNPAEAQLTGVRQLTEV